VDAIIVPTSRSIDSLRSSVTLARRHGCALLVLCSKNVTAAEVRQRVDREDVHVIAVDHAVVRDALPRFATDDLVTGTEFERSSDTSAKRNLGVLFALLAGWQRIVFLDDDIALPEPDDLGRAAGLLFRYPAVGLGLDGFPDNSVVCHANRDVGGFQETFIGGGAMAVDVLRMDSFFPDIYNEDWFFLLGGRKTGEYGVVGRAVQADYDPYVTPERARSEEFGDCLAEGLYALLDVNEFSRSRQKEYWTEFLAARCTLIHDIIGSLDAKVDDREKRGRMRAALTAALDRCQRIEAHFCVHYLDAWQADRRMWSQFVLRTWRGQWRKEGESGPTAALRTLGLLPQRSDQDVADLDRARVGVPGTARDRAEPPGPPAEPQIQPRGLDVGHRHRERDAAMSRSAQSSLGRREELGTDAVPAM
jgi:hypothetical protein